MTRYGDEPSPTRIVTMCLCPHRPPHAPVPFTWQHVDAAVQLFHKRARVECSGNREACYRQLVLEARAVLVSPATPIDSTVSGGLVQATSAPLPQPLPPLSSPSPPASSIQAQTAEDERGSFVSSSPAAATGVEVVITSERSSSVVRRELWDVAFSLCQQQCMSAAVEFQRVLGSVSERIFNGYADHGRGCSAVGSRVRGSLITIISFSQCQCVCGVSRVPISCSAGLILVATSSLRRSSCLIAVLCQHLVFRVVDIT